MTNMSDPYPTDLQHIFTKEQFIERLAIYYDTTNPLIDIPTALHAFRRLVNRTPNATCLYWPDVINQRYVTYSYEQVWNLSGRLLGHLKETQLYDIAATSIVGVLCDDNPGFLFLLTALYRGGYIPLLLSSRNSKEAIQSLVEKANASVVICSNPALSPNQIDKLRVCEYVPITPEMLLQLPNRDGEFELLQGNGDVDIMEETCAILHSSGTSRFPSLIKYSHRSVLANGLIVHRWARSTSFSSLNIGPLFHSMTFCATFAAMLCGVTPACFPLTSAPTPKPSELIQSIQLLKPTKVNLVPVMLQMICDCADADSTGDSWQILSELPMIAFGGAPLPSSLASRLRQHNLNVFPNYGSTEGGPIMTGVHRSPEDPYTYMWLVPEVSYRMVPSEICPGTYELYISRQSITLASLDDPSDFATKDCFIQNRPGVWEYHSRLNDILIHSNGEKTNALQMEMDIRKNCKAIEQVAVCGSGKPHTSALIEVDWAYVATKYVTLSELIGDIQSAVRHANEEAPSHSRIPPRSVHCLRPDLKLPVTAKGTVARAKAEKLFANLLELETKPDLKSETTRIPDQSTPPAWTEASLSNALAAEIAQQLDLPLETVMEYKTKPFMEYGVTSQIIAQLQVITEELLGRSIPPGLFYEHPSITEFSKVCLQSPEASQTQVSGVTEAISQLHSAYQSIIDDWAFALELLFKAEDPGSPNRGEAGPKVVMLIGASGGLGTELAYFLAKCPYFKRVVFLLRGPDPQGRLQKELDERHLQIDWQKVEVYEYQMDHVSFGLDLTQYKSLAMEVTHVIHNAWILNFNAGLDKYAAECIPGLMSSIRFCSAWRNKSITFISSISTMGRFAKDDSDTIPEVKVSNIDWVLPFGYAQSKYVAEILLEYAAEKLKLHTNIVRCGQLSGDRHRGLWNPKDFVSLLVCGGAADLKKMPTTRYPADIVPMDVAAEAICDIVTLTSTQPGAEIYHVANPHGGDWDNFLGLLRQNGLAFEEVEHKDFYEEVKKHPQNACYILLAWLHGETQAAARIRGHLDCTNTLQLSPSFKKCPPVDANLIRMYLDQWKAIGLLKV